MSIFQRISIMVPTVLVLGAVGASAGELPQYEVTGFPISPVQMSVLNSGRVQEEPPKPEVILHGMLVARCVCSRDASAVDVR
jgi:hypothetical protein